MRRNGLGHAARNELGMAADPALCTEDYRPVGDSLSLAQPLRVIESARMVMLLLHDHQWICACGISLALAENIDDFDVQCETLLKP